MWRDSKYAKLYMYIYTVLVYIYRERDREKSVREREGGREGERGRGRFCQVVMESITRTPEGFVSFSRLTKVRKKRK